MFQGRFYVYISEGPHLENRQPFHDFIFGTRQIRQPLQGRRISRVPKTTLTRYSFPGASIWHLTTIYWVSFSRGHQHEDSRNGRRGAQINVEGRACFIFR